MDDLETILTLKPQTLRLTITGMLSTIESLTSDNKRLFEEIGELKKSKVCDKRHKTERTSDEQWKKYEDKCLREGRKPNYN